MGASVSECEEVVVACVPYLSSHTPKEIQRVCVETLSVLAKYDPDMIWIVIVQLSPDLFLSSPPHHSLKHIKVCYYNYNCDLILYISVILFLDTTLFN